MSRDLTVEEIGEIAKHYCNTLSIGATAAATNHSYATVDKYVNEGDPTRGIPSIRAEIQRTGIKIPNAYNPQRFLERTAEEATAGSKSLIRAIKELFAYKVSAMLSDLEKAYQSGDEKQIQATQEKWFKEIRFRDLPRILDVEQVVWGLKSSMNGSPTDQPTEKTNRAEKIRALKTIIQDRSLMLNGSKILKKETDPVEVFCNECGSALSHDNPCPRCEPASPQEDE